MEGKDIAGIIIIIIKNIVSNYNKHMFLVQRGYSYSNVTEALAATKCSIQTGHHSVLSRSCILVLPSQ